MSEVKNSKGNKLFVDQYIIAKDAPNLIFICTPIVSVTDFQVCYQPFTDYGFNVFAFDFSGVGKSEGNAAAMNKETIYDDFISVVKYIKARSDAPLLVFGNTGTGGIIAQELMHYLEDITAFAQFGVCIYGDLSPFGMPGWIGKPAHKFLNLMSKLFPKKKITFNPPAYHGFHADLDNNFYKEWLQKDPDFFKVNFSFPALLMGIFSGRRELNIKVPTLVFKTNHDRYFSKAYFDKYYQSLTCPKKLVEIDDVHNSYYFYPELIAKEVSEWFLSLSAN